MRLTVTINGREALPVRAIPYVSGWNMSPDMVATALAHTDDARRLKNIFGYRVVDSEVVVVRPMQWDNVVVALNGLDERLPPGNDGYSKWRDESPKLLPEGVFVWLDEFSAAYGKAFSAANFICNDREGERELDLMPMIDLNTKSIAMAGFNSCELLGAEGSVVDAHQKETGVARDARIAERVKYLKNSGLRSFIQTVANEEGVSKSAIDQAVERHKKRSGGASQSSLLGQLKVANK